MGFWMVYPVKACTKCNIEFPATLEYFGVHSKNGLKSRCKSCLRQESKDRMNGFTLEARREIKRADRKRNVHVYRQASRKHRAIKNGVFHERWTEKQLLDTYGTDCYLCNLPIDFNAPRHGAGNSNSLWPDHVIPISKGGEDTIKNVRPCHSFCNISKHDQTYEEYMLTANSQDIVTQSL